MRAIRFAVRHKARGLTLVELMVTIVIALLLLAIVSAIYIAGKRSFSYQNASGRLQERARFAMEQISHSIRSVGFQGCGSLTSLVGNMTWQTAWDANPEAHWWLHSAAPVRAYQTLPSALATDFGSAEMTKGDVLITFHTDTASETGLTATTAAADNLVVASHSFADGELLVAYDCQRSVVFQKTGGSSTTIAHAASGTPGNCQAAFATSCTSGTSFGLSAGGFVSRLTVESYYIAPAQAGGGSSLWRRRLQGGTTSAEELVRHIEGLRVRFGLDTNGDQAADQYVRPATVATADWRRVVSARVELLAVSDEANLASSAQTGIQLDGDASARTTTDRRLYRIYSSTVNLRNRTL